MGNLPQIYGQWSNKKYKKWAWNFKPCDFGVPIFETTPPKFALWSTAEKLQRRSSRLSMQSPQDALDASRSNPARRLCCANVIFRNHCIWSQHLYFIGCCILLWIVFSWFFLGFWPILQSHNTLFIASGLLVKSTPCGHCLALVLF